MNTSFGKVFGWAVLAFAGPTFGQFVQPSGVYALGSANDNPGTTTDERLSGIRNYDFVSGFTLRVFWRDIEPVQGVYNFAVIDEAIRRTKAIGQHLNLEVLQSMPAYIVSGASSTYINHRGEVTPVPWDAFGQSRYAALMSAMATHIVNDGTGANLPLNQHPTVVSVDASSFGLNFGVRDLNNGIRSHPQYTQQKYIDSVVQGVGAARAAFPNHQGFLAFFGFVDGQPGTPVDQQLIALLDAQYNGAGQRSLAFFIENLSDIGPLPLPTPGGTGNNLLAWKARGGDTMMQALDSWLHHQPDRDASLMSRNPATGIALGFNTYGTRFFEVYVPDLDDASSGVRDAAGRPIIDDLRLWNARLNCVARAAMSPADLCGSGATYANGTVDIGPEGQLTVDDFVIFLSAFTDATGCPSATTGVGPCNPADIAGSGATYTNGTVDIGPDGDLTIEDFLIFLAAFSDGAGCP